MIHSILNEKVGLVASGLIFILGYLADWLTKNIPRYKQPTRCNWNAISWTAKLHMNPAELYDTLQKVWPSVS